MFISTLSLEINILSIEENWKREAQWGCNVFNTFDNIGPIPADPGFLDLVSENVINQDLRFLIIVNEEKRRKKAETEFHNNPFNDLS